MFKKITIAASLSLAVASVAAADYYVVVPVPNRTSPVHVELAAATLPAAYAGDAYPGFDFARVIQVKGDPEFTGAGVTWKVAAGALPAGLLLSATGQVSGTPTAVGTAIATVAARYKSGRGEQAYRITVKGKVAMQPGGYRAWSDGSAPASCAAYLNPTPGYEYTGAIGDGIYQVRLNGSLANVYCDMTTDGGGWMLTLYAEPPVTSDAYSVTLGESMVTGRALKTQSHAPGRYPVLPNGLPNTFQQVLFKGGTAAWQAQMGAWLRFSTFTDSASLSNTLQGVLTSTGRQDAYLANAGWFHRVPNEGVDTVLALWDANGLSPICGGHNSGAAKECPYFGQANAEYPFHYDTTSGRQLFVR